MSLHYPAIFLCGVVALWGWLSAHHLFVQWEKSYFEDSLQGWVFSIIQTLSWFKLGFDFLNYIAQNSNKAQIFSPQQSLALKYVNRKSTIGWFFMVCCFYSVHVIIPVLHCNLFVLGVERFNRPLLFVILEWYSIPVLIWKTLN